MLPLCWQWVELPSLRARNIHCGILRKGCCEDFCSLVSAKGSLASMKQCCRDTGTEGDCCVLPGWRGCLKGQLTQGHFPPPGLPSLAPGCLHCAPRVAAAALVCSDSSGGGRMAGAGCCSSSAGEGALWHLLSSNWCRWSSGSADNTEDVINQGNLWRQHMLMKFSQKSGICLVQKPPYFRQSC